MIYVHDNFSELTDTTSTGIPLPDVIECTVQEVCNGAFCSEMQYPINGAYAEKIIPNAILMIEPRKGANVEPFRIYETVENIKGVKTVRANHIAYDLDGSIVWGMTREGITDVLDRLNNLCPNHFVIVNDGITDETTEFNVIVPITIWSAIGGSNSLLTHFGGELSYHWDDNLKKCVITLHWRRGTLKNTVIKYGVNILSLQRKKSVGEMYSDVLAFWSDGQNAANNVWSDDYSTGVTAITRYLTIDASKEFQSAPTKAQLNQIVVEYMQLHDFTLQQELEVTYIPIEDTTEYEQIDNIAIVGSAIVGTDQVGTERNIPRTEHLDVCDYAEIDASFLGVKATARCVETIYDVLRKRYTKITIGTLQKTIIDTIVDLSEG